MENIAVIVKLRLHFIVCSTNCLMARGRTTGASHDSQLKTKKNHKTARRRARGEEKERSSSAEAMTWRERRVLENEKLLIKTRCTTTGSEQAAEDEKGRQVDPYDRQSSQREVAKNRKE
jgi:hypothetical protein